MLWISNFGIPRTLTKVENDPTTNAKMRGSGIIDIKNDVMTMTGSPRFYIHTPNKNVEFEASFKLNGWENDEPLSYSGFTMVLRSNHHLYKDDPCQARSYYVRYWNDGRIGFQKEMRHSSTEGTQYSNSNTIPVEPIQKGKWYHIKATVQDEIIDDTTYTWLTVELNGVMTYSIRHDQFKGSDSDCSKITDRIEDGNVVFIRTDKADSVKVKDVKLYEIKTLRNINISI